MKQKFKRFLSFVFNIPLGIAVVIAFVLFAAYKVIKDVYHQFRYNFSDVLHTFYFWAAIIGIGLIVVLIEERRKRK
ncbi:MAG: hypothetical protein ACTHNG_11070 [Ginsengibacter sp.]